jgi:hypothetical protein
MNGLMLASLAATVGLVRDGDRKIRLINLIAAALRLTSLVPSVTIAGVTVPPQIALRWMGPGYWLRDAGALLILISSIALLCPTSGTRSAGFQQRAEDTRL